jgi:hypothetical protein
MSERYAARLISGPVIGLTLSAWALTSYLNVFGATAATVRLTPETLTEVGMWSVLLPASWLAFALTGAWVLRAQSHNRVGWLCLGFGAFGALEDMCWQLARIAPGAAQAPLGILAGVFIALYLPALLTLLLLRFPDGNLVAPGWRHAERLVWLSVVIQSLCGAFAPRIWIGNETSVANPLYMLPVATAADASRFLDALRGLASFLGIALLLAACVSVVLRWQPAQGVAVRMHRRRCMSHACAGADAMAVASRQCGAVVAGRVCHRRTGGDRHCDTASQSVRH